MEIAKMKLYTAKQLGRTPINKKRHKSRKKRKKLYFQQKTNFEWKVINMNFEY